MLPEYITSISSLKNKEVVWITHDSYKKASRCCGNFRQTHIFDQECGLVYIYVNESDRPKERSNCFCFEVINIKKYCLAKIKYGF